MTCEKNGARPRLVSWSITGVTLLILAASALPPRFASATRHIAQPAIDFAQPALSKADRIQIGPNVQVSESRKDIAQYEVVIAADPKEAKNLVLASMASASPKDLDLHDVVTFTSSDDGNTWKLARVQKGQAENESYFDPHLAYGADGSAYMVTMRNNPR
jgi:hypothetical protein